jgi:hypothetical protein
MQTQPADFPASVIIVQTSLPVPVVQGVVHVPLSATVVSQTGGEAPSVKHTGGGLS